MRYVVVAALVAALIVYGVVSRRPDLIGRERIATVRTWIEGLRPSVVKQPLTWFVALGAVPAIVLGVAGSLLDVDFYPAGMASLAALAVAWACDDRPRETSRRGRRWAVGVGFAVLFLAPDIVQIALRLPHGAGSREVSPFLEELARFGLVPAVIIGWVLSADGASTPAVRELVQRTWVRGPRWTIPFALLAWPLVTAVVMLLWHLTGVADLESTRVDPFEFLLRDSSGLLTDAVLFTTDLLGMGVWVFGSFEGAVLQLLELVSSVVAVAPVVLAWYGFAAPRLARRMSPLLVALSICLLASLGQLWMFLPFGSGGLSQFWAFDGREVAGVVAAGAAVGGLVAVTLPVTGVWLHGRCGDGLLAIVLLFGAGSLLASLVSVSWVDWDHFWLPALSLGIAQVGVGVGVMVAARMWRRSGPEPDEATPESGDGASGGTFDPGEAVAETLEGSATTVAAAAEE